MGNNCYMKIFIEDNVALVTNGTSIRGMNYNLTL